MHVLFSRASLLPQALLDVVTDLASTFNVHSNSGLPMLQGTRISEHFARILVRVLLYKQSLLEHIWWSYTHDGSASLEYTALKGPRHLATDFSLISTKFRWEAQSRHSYGSRSIPPWEDAALAEPCMFLVLLKLLRSPWGSLYLLLWRTSCDLVFSSSEFAIYSFFCFFDNLGLPLGQIVSCRVLFCTIYQLYPSASLMLDIWNLDITVHYSQWEGIVQPVGQSITLLAEWHWMDGSKDTTTKER